MNLICYLIGQLQVTIIHKYVSWTQVTLILTYTKFVLFSQGIETTKATLYTNY